MVESQLFHGGVVVGVASAAHAADDAVRGEHAVIILAGVRAALIGIEVRVGIRPVERKVQRADVFVGCVTGAAAVSLLGVGPGHFRSCSPWPRWLVVCFAAGK
jgi:hypothetical protein